MYQSQLDGKLDASNTKGGTYMYEKTKSNSA